jgi:hypothetical protein
MRNITSPEQRYTLTLDSAWVVRDDGAVVPVADSAYVRWRAAGNTPVAPSAASIIQHIVCQAQNRLDTWARSRGYDGILSACTYATSQVPRFQAEGQRCVDLRDQTWARLYEILAEVEAGTRPVPLSLTEIEADLPVLMWECDTIPIERV